MSRLGCLKSSFLLLFLMSFPGLADAQGGHEATQDVTQLSIEELMGMTITSVSKKEGRAFEAPSALYVLTQEDIRRSGATHVAEALRMVPGLQVAKVDASTWAISARGENSDFANKLLVLIDGRSVYTQAFGGVYWDFQGLPLYDVERIEVIRGPGGTLWGANAVNGVINIITKHSKDTQGVHAEVGGGFEDRVFGGVRYGSQINEKLSYRLHTQYKKRDSSEFADPSQPGHATDAWWNLGGGLRLDWEADSKNHFCLTSDISRLKKDFLLQEPTSTAPFLSSIFGETKGTKGHVLAHWTHEFAPDTVSDTQFYFTRYDRTSSGLVEENYFALSGEAQLRTKIEEGVEVTIGGNYRYTSLDGFNNGTFVVIDPTEYSLHLGGGFIHGEFHLIPDQLRFFAGVKVDHNSFTGFEIQPSAKLLWVPNPKHALWVSVAKAVRTPSVVDTGVRYLVGVDTGPPVTLIRLNGSSAFESENLWAYELGYRIQPYADLSLDFAGFYNQYGDMETAEFGSVGFDSDLGAVVQETNYSNLGEYRSYGVEFSGAWALFDFWKLNLGYSFLKIDADLNSNLTASILINEAVNRYPMHQIQLRSYLDLPFNLELDTAFFFVDELRVHDASDANADFSKYLRADIRLGWRPMKNLDVSLVGQNLIHEHQEFPSLLRVSQQKLERNFFGKLTYEF